MKLVADSFALLNLRFLSVPVWHIYHYARLAARVRLTRVVLDDPVLKRRHSELLHELSDVRDKWKPWKPRKPWKAWCLHIGTAAGLLAAMLTVIVSVREVMAGTTHCL